MKKRLLITILFFTCLSFIYSQPELGYVKIGDETFIKISTKTIIKFLNQPMSDWEDLMVKNGYELMDDSEGIATYTKGKIGERIQAVAKNRVGVISIDWYDFINKTKTTSELEESLKNNFMTSKENLNYYYLNNYIIGIESHLDENHLFERVLIRLK